MLKDISCGRLWDAAALGHMAKLGDELRSKGKLSHTDLRALAAAAILRQAGISLWHYGVSISKAYLIMCLPACIMTSSSPKSHGLTYMCMYNMTCNAHVHMVDIHGCHGAADSVCGPRHAAKQCRLAGMLSAAGNLDAGTERGCREAREWNGLL